MMHCCRLNRPTAYKGVQMQQEYESKNIKYNRKTLTGIILLHVEYLNVLYV